jgi:hypothetical protein
MSPGVASLLLAATVLRPFADERALLDRRLETLRRILPDGANPTADAAVVTEMLKGARLSSYQALARPPLESGARGNVLVDVTATGRFGEVDRFFRLVALSHRLVDVESVALAAAPGDLVRLTALLHFPYRPTGAGLPPPPEGLRVNLKEVARPQAQAFLRDQSLSLAKAEAIVTLRRARRNPRMFLSEMAAVVRERPVVLKEATLGDEFLIRGLVVGEGPMRALESRFERGFFRIAEVLMVRHGSCYRFEARGRSPVVGIEAEIPLPAEDPFRQDDTPCQVDRDTGSLLSLRGPVSKTPSRGPHSLRLRDVDLADVFQALHLATGESFLVDEDVRGRVSVDLDRLTMEEMLAILARAGVRVSGTGRMRRVSRGLARDPAAPGPSPAAEAAAAPLGTFSLKRAPVRDLLAILGEADPGLVSVAPRTALGRLTLWTKDVAMSELRGAILDAAALSERQEEGRRVVFRSDAPAEPAVPLGEMPAERRLVMRPQDLALTEFQLAGVVSAGGGWTALAYLPTGTLGVYRVGDRLADATITEVHSTDVVLATDEGTVRLTLPSIQ